MAYLEIRGVATGCIWVFIPPKSAHVNFLWGKNDVRLFNSFIPPPQKKKLYPQNKFLATPLLEILKLGAREYISGVHFQVLKI